MSSEWKDRQRRTNRLVRFCFEYIVLTGGLTPENIRALCHLTWITKGDELTSIAYIESAKKPALETIFRTDYSGFSLQRIAEDIESKTDADREFLFELVGNHTGFTNYYNAYRNSCLRWIRKYFKRIGPMVGSAHSLASHADASKLAAAIDRLPRIPNPSASQSMAPANLLTPLFFSLDERLRFPIINKADHITALLRTLGVRSSNLVDRHNALVGLIGEGEIGDAVDLDCMRGLPAESSPAASASGSPLTLKDEADYQVLKKNTSIKAKRIHNSLTNALVKYAEANELVIDQGGDNSCRYDALLKGFPVGEDLLIEAKSSTERADVRMAIGQLYDYHRLIPDGDSTSKGVLLPSVPDDEVKALLGYAGVYLLYFSGSDLIAEWHGD